VTDGQTDRQTEFSSLDCVCIPCSAVKNSTKTTIYSLPRLAYTSNKWYTKPTAEHYLINTVLNILSLV